MGFKLKFNKQALDAFAKNLERASWGAAAVGPALAAYFSQGAAIIIGGALWLVLQIVALYLKFIEWED